MGTATSFGHPVQALAERWNGVSWIVWNGSFWALQATQDPFGAIFDTLNSVSCASATSCLAVAGNGKSAV